MQAPVAVDRKHRPDGGRYAFDEFLEAFWGRSVQISKHRIRHWAAFFLSQHSEPHPLTEQEDATYRVKEALTVDAAIKRAIRELGIDDPQKQKRLATYRVA